MLATHVEVDSLRSMFEHEKQRAPMANEIDPKRVIRISMAVNKAAKLC